MMTRSEIIQSEEKFEKDFLSIIFDWENENNEIYLAIFFKNILQESYNHKKNEDQMDFFTMILENFIFDINENQKLGILNDFFKHLEKISFDFISLDDKNANEDFYFEIKKEFENKNESFKEFIKKQYLDEETYFDCISNSLGNKIYLFSENVLGLINKKNLDLKELDDKCISENQKLQIEKKFKDAIKKSIKEHINFSFSKFKYHSSNLIHPTYNPDEFEEISLSDEDEKIEDSKKIKNKNISSEKKDIIESENSKKLEKIQKSNKFIQFFKKLMQKWNALSIPWKILAGTGFFIGIGAMITASIFFPPSLMVTVPIIGKIAVSTLMVTAGTTIAASSLVGHLVHVATKEPKPHKDSIFIEKKQEKQTRKKLKIHKKEIDDEEAKPRTEPVKNDTKISKYPIFFNALGKIYNPKNKPNSNSKHYKKLRFLNCLRPKLKKSSPTKGSKYKSTKPSIS